MAVKIYADGNYIVISGSEMSPDIDLNDSKKNVTCHQLTSNRFLLSSEKLGEHIFEIGDDLLNALDVAYTVETFTTFYRENTVFPDASLVGALSGVADYEDTGTAITPITLLSGVFSNLTNNALGLNTDVANLPYGVSVLWDSANNQFDFSELAIGTKIDVRFDVSIIVPINNTEVVFAMDFAIGGTPYTLNLFRKYYKFSGTYLNETFVTFFYVKNENMMNFPAKPKIKMDSNSTVIVNGWLCSISNLKK